MSPRDYAYIYSTISFKVMGNSLLIRVRDLQFCYKI